MKAHQHLRRERGRHDDDWLITYADTITLLLCLFVIILSIKTARDARPMPPPAQIDHATMLADIFDAHPPFPPVTRGTDMPASDAAAGPPPRMKMAGDAIQAANTRDIAEPAVEPPPVNMTMSEMPFVLGEWRGLEAPKSNAVPPRPAHIANDEPRGDRVTMLQISSAAFFASGYAALSGAGKSILRDVAVTLKSEKFAAYDIRVEGHTDDTPISTAQFQSNWELSAARAAAVARYLLELGIPARRLSAAGYADTFPVAPNRDADGTVIPENQARNRRVVIKLEKIEKAER